MAYAEHAVVVAAEVTSGTGSLANEPVTIATLRAADGRERVVRIVGGATARGGFARLAGYVVPIPGARVRIDLREERGALTLRLPPVSGQSWVHNDPAGTWDPAKLPVVFDLALPMSRDLGADAAREVEVAARTWERPACTAFRARYGTTKTFTAADDGDNGVFFHDDTWPEELVPGAIAQTILHDDGAGKLHDADIHVNGSAFRFSKDGAEGTQDIRSVLVHEIGHALGLGHSDNPRATMFLTGSGLRWRSLEQDDINGVCSLYPGTGGDSCDADPCPTGFVCVAGACQEPGDRADVCAPCDPETVGTCEAAGDDARCIDLGGGRVCGRSCATDEQCGVGFACRPANEAGERQCVSLSGCRNGANLCTTDADCTRSLAGDVFCSSGACVGRGPADAGSSLDSGPPDAGGNDLRGGGNDCDCRAVSTPSSPVGTTIPLLLLVLSFFRRRSR